MNQLPIKFPTWMGLEPWHSGLWVQSLARLPQRSLKGIKTYSITYSQDLPRQGNLVRSEFYTIPLPMYTIC